MVSVIMPVRNGGRFLEMAVRSVQYQTFPDWELLLLDDGSSDGAVEHIALWNDPRIRIVKHTEGKGVAVRLNEGVAMARGQFIARMDADDIAFPMRFAKQVDLLTADQTLDLVGVGFATIDENNHLIGIPPMVVNHEEICRRPWQGFYLAHPGWMGRIAWFRENPYRCPAPYASEDQELLLRTHTYSKYGCVPQILLAYRLRGQIDWSKLIRTRSAVLKFQCGTFASTGNFLYILLAVMCYGFRVAHDAWSRMRGRKFFPGAVISSGDSLRFEWDKIVRLL